MKGEKSPELKAPLRATARGQTIIVGLSVAATFVFLGAVAGAFFVGQSLAPASEVPVAPPQALSFEQGPIIFPSLTGGPQSPGTYPWDELRGGECLSAFDTAFAEEFSVVGCETPHPAQLVKAALLSRDRSELFPGESAVLTEAAAVCEVAELIDPEVAAGFSHLVIDLAYPLSNKQWDAGQRVVYCFIRSSGGEMIKEDLLAQR